MDRDRIGDKILRNFKENKKKIVKNDVFKKDFLFNLGYLQIIKKFFRKNLTNKFYDIF